MKKKLLAFALALAMVVSALPGDLTGIEAKAAEKNLEVGDLAREETGNMYTYTFPNLTIRNNDIKSVSVQFRKAVHSKDTLSCDVSGTDFEIKTNNRTHLIINAKEGTFPTADQWNTLLRNRLKAYISDKNVVRYVLFSMEDNRQERLVEYNELNGHYYEVVNEAKTWQEARSEAKNKRLPGSYGEKYDSYLVNITSEEENNFVYSICDRSTWLGMTCDPDAEIYFPDGTKTKIRDYSGYQSPYKAVNNNRGYWFFVDGPEAGKLMCSTRMYKTNETKMAAAGTTMEIKESGKKLEGAMEDANYNNWANTNNWPKSSMYEQTYTNPSDQRTATDLTDYDTDQVKEPNNEDNSNADYHAIGSEYYMCIYSWLDLFNDSLNNKYYLKHYMIPSMWNDFSYCTKTITSYVVEYSLKEGVTDDTQDEIVVVPLALKGEYTPEPTVAPTAKPTVAPTAKPTVAPTAEPTVEPTVEPTADPTVESTAEPTVEPTKAPTAEPTVEPTAEPTKAPTVEPTAEPTKAPTAEPTVEPTAPATAAPTLKPGQNYVNGQDIIVKKNAPSPDLIRDSEAVVLDAKGNPVPAVIYANPGTVDTGDPNVIPVQLISEDAYPDEIKVYVKDNVTTGNPEGANPGDPKVTIGANDFNMSVADAKENGRGSANELTSPLVKALASVVAQEGDQMIPTDEIAIKYNGIQGEPGKYPVVFSYKGVDVTAIATVRSNSSPSQNVMPDAGEDNNEDQSDKVFITGNNMVVAKDDVFKDPEDFSDRTDVKAVNGNGTPINDITVDPEDLAFVNEKIREGEKGTYPVKVTAANEEGKTATVTLTVTVKDAVSDEDAQGKKTGEVISANDFIIGVEDYNLVTGPDKVKNVVALSDGEAYTVDDKTPVAITGVDTSKVQNEPGVYEVALTTDQGTSVTVKCTVSDEYKTIGDPAEAGEANKAKRTIDNPTAIRKDAIVTVDQVFDKSNGTDVSEPVKTDTSVTDIQIDKEKLEDKDYEVVGDKVVIAKEKLQELPAGDYPVVIQYNDGTTSQFNLKVVDYDADSVITKVPILKMNKNILKKSKFKLNLRGIKSYAVKKYSSSNKKVATINKKGVIKGKKLGKCKIKAYVIQNGSYYKVEVNLKVLKKSKNLKKIYNLKKKALVKVSGELPEYNVYKRVFKNSKTTVKFKNIEDNAKVKVFVPKKYKKEGKKIKIGKIVKNKKKDTIRYKISGKKRGFVHLTCRIKQNGKTYFTRLFVRVDDHKKDKNTKKYLK